MFLPMASDWFGSRPCSQCPEGALKCLAGELKMECSV